MALRLPLLEAGPFVELASEPRANVLAGGGLKAILFEGAVHGSRPDRVLAVVLACPLALVPEPDNREHAGGGALLLVLAVLCRSNPVEGR